jgi:hypothetical protein
MDTSVSDPADTLALKVPRENTSSSPQVAEEKSIPAEVSSPEAAPCPRCGGKLTNPEGLGWCPACGYCRSLEEDVKKVALMLKPATGQPSALGMVEFFEVLGRLPMWLWVLLGGTTCVAVISIAASFMLPDNSLARALWCTIQVGAGLLGLFAAQAWSLVILAPESDHLGAKDLILSARLWKMTCRFLPATQWQVWLGSWSAAAMLCAVFIVGGYSYWYQFYKPKRIADKGLIQAIADAAAKARGKNKSLEESVEEMAKMQDLTKKKDDAKKDIEDKRATQQCVIIGYTTETDKDQNKETVSTLLLATVVDDRLKFTGVVRRGISAGASDELLKRLEPLVQPEPFIPGLKLQAIWVKPQVFCDVHQSGLDAEGHLKSPRFKDVLN